MPLSLRAGWLPLVALAAGCGAPPPAVQPPDPPVVTVAKPIRAKTQPWLEFVGRTEATDTVNLKADVTGKVTKVMFRGNNPQPRPTPDGKGTDTVTLTEGGLVTEGDLLFTLDPVPYQTALDQATAQRDGSTDRLRIAEADFKRWSAGGGSAVEVNKAKEARDTAKNQTAEYQAKVDAAADLLKKCRVVAPVSGRISRALVTEGNTVTANVTDLTRIIAIDPIYAVWDVDENTSLYYRRMIDDKVIPNPRDTPLKCRIKLKNETAFSREGHIDYIDPEINRGSAARPIRGTFENPNGYMTPGDSVRVQVEAGPSREVILIPPGAVGSQQSQKFVYVVQPDGTALPRNVELGELTDGLQVVTKGLTEADTVVVNGLLRVRPGDPVKAVFEDKDSAAK